jgi:hypothetical protein
MTIDWNNLDHRDLHMTFREFMRECEKRTWLDFRALAGELDYLAAQQDTATEYQRGIAAARRLDADLIRARL